MKNFFRFLSEAKESQASMQARRMGLKGDGHGGWYNAQGEFVAKTEKGELKFYNQGQRVGQRDLPQQRTKANQQVAATQAATTPTPAAAETPGAEEEPKTKEGGSVTLVFGRFNPPTVGHQKLLNAAAGVSSGSELRVYPSRSQDPKKNPLDPSTKIKYMKQMFPKYEESIIDDDKMKTIFDVLITADEDGFNDVTIVVGGDRLGEFKNLANKYNGDLYTFDSINVVSAGERDADATGVVGMSASAMRKAAADNDFETFRRGIPKSLDDDGTKQLFNAVRKAMKITTKEGYSLWEIAPKMDWQGLRENYYMKKIFCIGSLVENLNTGLIGEVMRRGANHLICVTEEGRMFKSWIKDLMEYSEVKVEKKMRAPGKPNTLAGTGGYFKYAVDMTPGFNPGDKTNLQPGAKPYSGYKQSNAREFINKYKKR
jgi:hypothetical protein